MTLEQGPRDCQRTMVSPLDLSQVRDAVREVRACHPGSILADLVEEKIRALESASHHFVSDLFEDFRISRPLNS
ncbi:hypothetical protein IC232_04155 [Microvirga sp. BT688]|uniref:hypothetical protein n=1 Tax=Microvirga sp. TaxID=1873136 RepID=UPI001689B43A|nr:hypothetical protein [Microvirga sp.]MBD2745886.1 hypothetical protein [Microvirga sp.]